MTPQERAALIARSPYRNYAERLAESLSKSQRNHLRVLLEMPEGLDWLRHALGAAPTRRNKAGQLVERRRADRRAGVLEIEFIRGNSARSY